MYLQSFGSKISVYITDLKLIYFKSKIGGEQEIFCLLVHSPNGCQDQVWAGMKPGARNLVSISHIVARSQVLGPSFAFPGGLAGS